jgi:glycosyltransferase involved in cell wall biosynthesis
MKKSDHVAVFVTEPRFLLNHRRSLVEELLRQGYRVTAVCDAATAKELNEFTQLGVEYRAVTVSRGGMSPFGDLRTLKQLNALFGEIKPDAVVSSTSKPVIFGSIASSSTKVPKVVSMITGLGYSFIEGREVKRRIARLAATSLYRIALPKCSSIIFHNADDLRMFEEIGLLKPSAPVHVVNGSGVDINYYKVAPQHKVVNFVMISRLLADKGVREYAAAGLALRKSHSNSKVTLVGGLDASPNSVTAQELAHWRAQGLDFAGEVSDVRPLIAAASVVVLPSYREGTPRAILEGMAMGRAIITTNAPGCRETVVDGRNGVLVPPRDTKNLVGAMQKLADDPALVAAMGRNSRLIVCDKFDSAAVARDTIAKAGL